MDLMVISTLILGYIFNNSKDSFGENHTLKRVLDTFELPLTAIRIIRQ